MAPSGLSPAQGDGGFKRGPLATVGLGEGEGLAVGVGVGGGVGVGVGFGVGVAVGGTTLLNVGVSGGGCVLFGESSPDANTRAARAAAIARGSPKRTTVGTPRSGQSPVLCADRR